jgi:hypothetical protein
MKERFLEKDEIYSMLIGVGILGTGGGGDPESFGKPLVDWDLKKKREYRIVPYRSVKDDAFVVSGGYAGSVKTYTAVGKTLQRWEKKFELLEALKVAENLHSRKVDHVVPFELGGINTPVILSLAARAGISAIDGDGLGRAAPETQMSTFLGHGISLTPMPFVDKHGNVLIVKKTTRPAYPDEIMRLALDLDSGIGANTHYPMNGRLLKKSVIPDTITYSIKIGDAVINAVRSRKDPVEAFINISKGFELFDGTVKEIKGEDFRAHYLAKATLKGTGEYKGKTMEIFFKNESMLAKTDGRVVAVFPDLICMLNPKKGTGIMTTRIEAGTKMVVIGVPAHKRLRECLENDSGRKALSPERYGMKEVRYEPIEKLVKRRPG